MLNLPWPGPVEKARLTPSLGFADVTLLAFLYQSFGCGWGGWVVHESSHFMGVRGKPKDFQAIFYGFEPRLSSSPSSTTVVDSPESDQPPDPGKPVSLRRLVLYQEWTLVA
jgi:hypothetical protein